MSLLLCLCVLPAGYALAETPEIEDNYLQILTNGSVTAKTVVAKKITQDYISNPEIFASIERSLLADCGRASEIDFVDMLSWYCKALASSGQDKYLQVLREVEGCAIDPKLQMHAQKSIDSLAFHSHRNRVLSRAAEFVARGYDQQAAELAVMLEADDWRLKRDAAKTVFRATMPDKRLFGLISDQLLAGLSRHGEDYNTYVDSMSWLCKALSVSGERNYLATLQKVAAETDAPKLQRYAQQAGDVFAD